MVLLKALGCTVPDNQHRAGWVLSDCPLGPWNHEHGHSSPEKFGVRMLDGYCKCFSCDWHGTLPELVDDVYGLAKAKRLYGHPTPALTDIDFKKVGKLVTEFEKKEVAVAWDTIFTRNQKRKTKLHEFPQEWLNSFVPWHSWKPAVAYLKKRGVNTMIADLLDLRADTVQERVCFPVRDLQHKLMGLHGRAIKADNTLRYRMYLHNGHNNQIVWLGEDWVDFDRPIVVVEGPFDLLSVLRVYGNTVCPLFSSPSFEKLARMEAADKWITFYDNGTGGDKGRQKVDKFIGNPKRVQHLIPPEGIKDPGEMDLTSIRESLKLVLPDELLMLDVSTN